MKRFFDILYRLTNYNIKIIFGNKFIYFVLSAIVIFIATAFINLMSERVEFMESTAYNVLLAPSILVIFYPMCFGIQNDQDAKIIEIIFGIPNYRYKVWLFRLLIAYVICFAITLGLAFLTDWLLIAMPVFELTYQVLIPAFFVGTMAFMFSTIIRNGSGTAVVMIIFGLIFFISSKMLKTNKWNVFLNPFEIPTDVNPVVYYGVLFDNRLILLICAVLFLLIGLYKTQNRERFI